MGSSLLLALLRGRRYGVVGVVKVVRLRGNWVRQCCCRQLNSVVGQICGIWEIGPKRGSEFLVRCARITRLVLLLNSRIEDGGMRLPPFEVGG